MNSTRCSSDDDDEALQDFCRLLGGALCFSTVPSSSQVILPQSITSGFITQEADSATEHYSEVACPVYSLQWAVGCLSFMTVNCNLDATPATLTRGRRTTSCVLQT